MLVGTYICHPSIFHSSRTCDLSDEGERTEIRSSSLVILFVPSELAGTYFPKEGNNRTFYEWLDDGSLPQEQVTEYIFQAVI